LPLPDDLQRLMVAPFTYLNDDEFENLSVLKGTLTQQERDIIKIFFKSETHLEYAKTYMSPWQIDI
jgi:hypothetical protein